MFRGKYRAVSYTHLSLSQFNHPGNTFGTFGDFAFWDPVIDSRMYMVEAGNGEGQIGAGGYYPSYEYYTCLLYTSPLLGTMLPSFIKI